MTYDGRTCRYYTSKASHEKQAIYDWQEIGQPPAEIAAQCQEIRQLYNPPRKVERKIDIRFYKDKGGVKLKGVYEHIQPSDTATDTVRAGWRG